MAHFETERILKVAEAQTRLDFYKNFKSAREGKHGTKISMNIFIIFYLNCILAEIVRDDPTANQIHLRRLEEHQICERTKRLVEARVIEKEMHEFDERAQKDWQKK